MADKWLQEYTPFTVKFWATQLPDQSHLIPFCRWIRDNDKTYATVSNRGGWQSQPFNYGDHKELDQVYDIIRPYVDTVYEFMGVKGTPVDGGTWININKKYNFNVTHKHPSAYFSAVLYIKTPKNSGDIVFERPDLLDDYIRLDKITEHNACIWNVGTEPNKLIIFPAYLGHYVDQNLTTEQDDERISIAFNFR